MCSISSESHRATVLISIHNGYVMKPGVMSESELWQKAVPPKCCLVTNTPRLSREDPGTSTKESDLYVNTMVKALALMEKG